MWADPTGASVSNQNLEYPRATAAMGFSFDYLSLATPGGV